MRVRFALGARPDLPPGPDQLTDSAPAVKHAGTLLRLRGGGCRDCHSDLLFGQLSEVDHREATPDARSQQDEHGDQPHQARDGMARRTRDEVTPPAADPYAAR